MYFPFTKVQLHQSSLMYVAMATIQLLDLKLKLESPLSFKYFHLRETFCGITFYALDIIILRSLIKANIRTVTMETSEKSFCSNMVIDTKTTD